MEMRLFICRYGDLDFLNPRRCPLPIFQSNTPRVGISFVPGESKGGTKINGYYSGIRHKEVTGRTSRSPGGILVDLIFAPERLILSPNLPRLMASLIDPKDPFSDPFYPSTLASLFDFPIYFQDQKGKQTPDQNHHPQVEHQAGYQVEHQARYQAEYQTGHQGRFFLYPIAPPSILDKIRVYPFPVEDIKMLARGLYQCADPHTKLAHETVLSNTLANHFIGKGRMKCLGTGTSRTGPYVILASSTMAIERTSLSIALYLTKRNSKGRLQGLVLQGFLYAESKLLDAIERLLSGVVLHGTREAEVFKIKGKEYPILPKDSIKPTSASTLAYEEIVSAFNPFTYKDPVSDINAFAQEALELDMRDVEEDDSEEDSNNTDIMDDMDEADDMGYDINGLNVLNGMDNSGCIHYLGCNSYEMVLARIKESYSLEKALGEFANEMHKRASSNKETPQTNLEK